MKNVRTCLGCRQRATRISLVRFVASNGEIVADHSASLPGRGAWVHPSIECVDTALTRKAFGRALRKPDVAIDGVALRQTVLRQVALRQDATSHEATSHDTTNHSIGTPSGSPQENRLDSPVKTSAVNN